MPGTYGPLRFSDNIDGPSFEVTGHVTEEDLSEEQLAADYITDDTDEEDGGIPYEDHQLLQQRKRKRQLSPIASKKDDTNRVKVPGGRAPVPKKVTNDWDSDDEIIHRMKSDGYTDQQVADKLIKEGRTRYKVKSISSRFARLRSNREKIEEEVLDDQLSDWHVDDDKCLSTTIESVNQKLDNEIERINMRRWTAVSRGLAEKMGKRKYSAKACKERYEGLKHGTALLPIELDTDKAGRLQLRHTRQVEAHHRRADEKAAEHCEAEAQNRRRLGRLAATREKQRILDAEKVRRLEELTELKRIREERIIMMKMAREERNSMNAGMKLQLGWDRARIKAEKGIMKEMKRQIGNGERRLAKERNALVARGKPRIGKGAGRKTRQNATADDGYYIREEEDDDSFAGVEQATNEVKDETISRSYNADNAVAEDGSSNAPTELTSGTPSSNAIPPAKKITPRMCSGPKINARAIMSLAELDILLHERGLPRRSRIESQPEVVARLAAADDTLSVSELRDLLRGLFRPSQGPKTSLVKQLQDADAEESTAGKNDVNATDYGFPRDYHSGKWASTSGVAGKTAETTGKTGAAVMKKQTKDIPTSFMGD